MKKNLLTYLMFIISFMFSYHANALVTDTLQAEDATLGGGAAIESNHSGYEGTGFVNLPTSDGYIEFDSINGGTGGDARLIVRYALDDSERSGLLIVNGNSQSLTAYGTGSWSSWGTIETSMLLAAGDTNTISIQSNGNDFGNVDQIIYLSDTINNPSGLVLSFISNNEVGLDWTDNSLTEDGYIIEAKIKGGTYSVIDTVATDTTSYNATGLTADTLYYFKVYCYDSLIGNSGAIEDSILTQETIKTSVPSGGDWNDPATWVEGAVPASYDKVYIVGDTVTNIQGACDQLTVQSDAVAVLSGDLDVTRILEVDSLATLLCKSHIVTGNEFVLNNAAALGIGSADGITTVGNNAGNIQTSLRAYASDATYIYNGTVAQSRGNALPTQNSNIIIDNPVSVDLGSFYGVLDGSITVEQGVLIASEINITDNYEFINNADTNAFKQVRTSTPTGGGEVNLTISGTSPFIFNIFNSDRDLYVQMQQDMKVVDQIGGYHGQVIYLNDHKLILDNAITYDRLYNMKFILDDNSRIGTNISAGVIGDTLPFLTRVFDTNEIKYDIEMAVNDYKGVKPNSEVVVGLVSHAHPQINVMWSPNYLSKYVTIDSGLAGVDSINYYASFTYQQTDENGIPGLYKGAFYDGSSWDTNTIAIDIISRIISKDSLTMLGDIYAFGDAASCNEVDTMFSTNVVYDGASLNWNGVKGAQNYEIQYKANDSANWNMITGITDTTYFLDSLSSQTKYEWVVVTHCVAGYESSSGLSSIDTFTTLVTDIDELTTENDLLLYPVPAKDQLNLSIENDYSGTIYYVIYDLTGMVVDEGKLEKTTHNIVYDIDIEGLNSGMYIIEIKGADMIDCKRFNIE